VALHEGGALPYMASAPDQGADGIGFPIPETFPKGGDHIPNILLFACIKNSSSFLMKHMSRHVLKKFDENQSNFKTRTGSNLLNFTEIQQFC
jgi:hypothetical protein